GQAARSAGRRPEDGGIAAEAVRLARGDARRGAFLPAGRRASPLQAHRVDGRGGAASGGAARRRAELAGRRRPAAIVGTERAGEAARRESAVDVLSHALLAELHPTGHHPERPERLAALLEAFDWREGRAATDEEILRCHTPEHVRQIREIHSPT